MEGVDETGLWWQPPDLCGFVYQLHSLLRVLAQGCVQLHSNFILSISYLLYFTSKNYYVYQFLLKDNMHA